MNDDIFTLEQKFQPYLLNNDYTFVGPVDEDLFNNFIQIAYRINADQKVFYTTHCTLSNTEITRKALQMLPNNAPTRIYVIVNTKLLLHATIEKYCKRNNIDFNIN